MRTVAALTAFCVVQSIDAIQVQQQEPSLKDKLLYLTSQAFRDEHSVTKKAGDHCASLHTKKICKAPSVFNKSSAVVVSTYKEDLLWLNDLNWPGDVSVFVHDRSQPRTHVQKGYRMDDLDIAERSEVEVRAANAKRKKPVEFETIPNKGDEAAAYLSYIIKNYKRLPDIVYFIQGHRCAVHADFDMLQVLHNVHECFPVAKGYLDLNRYDGSKPPAAEPHCDSTKNLIQTPVKGFQIENFQVLWYSLFAEHLGEMPVVICWDSFAQFGVTKERIRQRPLAYYEKLLKATTEGATTMEFFWKATFLPETMKYKDKKEQDYQNLVQWVMEKDMIM